VHTLSTVDRSFDNVQVIAAGRTLFWEGDDCEHVFELRSGIVRGVSISEEGERQVTAFFFPGDEIGLPITRTYRYSAEAVTDVTYVRHSQLRWREALAESCRRDGKLLRAIGTEQDPIFRRGLFISRNGAVARVAAFIASTLRKLARDERGYAFPIPQVDIADYLALTPETVCRALRRLRELGLIDFPGQDHLVVHDRNRLEQVASRDA
jgi:CRP-like cAMP-binding protein